jgi:hypothetical protein
MVQKSSLLSGLRGTILSTEVAMAGWPVLKMLILGTLVQELLVRELHLYYWPGTAARSYATWMGSSRWGMPGWA